MQDPLCRGIPRFHWALRASAACGCAWMQDELTTWFPSTSAELRVKNTNGVTGLTGSSRDRNGSDGPLTVSQSSSLDHLLVKC